MPLFHEPIMHDRQSATVNGPIVIAASGSFTTIPGSTLTTKDLGSDGDYLVIVNAEIMHSNNNSVIDLRFCIDGVPTGTRSITFGPNSAGDPKSLSVTVHVDGVPKDITIDIQWRTDTSSATLDVLDFLIDGIPEHRVVQ